MKRPVDEQQPSLTQRVSLTLYSFYSVDEGDDDINIIFSFFVICVTFVVLYSEKRHNS